MSPIYVPSKFKELSSSVIKIIGAMATYTIGFLLTLTMVTLLPAQYCALVHNLQNFGKLSLGSNGVGPESIAFDPKGEGPYTGVADGRILKWQGPDLGWAEFATSTQRVQGCDGSENMENVCGRPLGLQFNEANEDLYIADAYLGLLAVGPRGGVATRLVDEAEGVPFRFTNGLDIDQETGIVYFTDSSANFQRRDYLWLALSGDATGRFMKYDPKTKTVTVLKRHLSFPNGVAVSKGNRFLLIAETSPCRILRYWLRGPKTDTLEVFAELPGYPDNIKKNSHGEFWVALNQEKVDSHGSFASSGKRPVAMRLDGEGKVVEVFDGGMLMSVSEVDERNGSFWFGSVDMPYVGYFKI